MKFTVSSTDLLKAILTVQKAIPAKTTEAILEDYLFVLKGETLEITASDMELTLKTELSVQSTEEEGSIAVPAKQLTDLLKELPDQPVVLNTANENSFECAWTSGSSTLPYFNPEDYPVFQTPGETAVTIEVPAQTLSEGISSTVYASSDEENRPIMNSIFFDIKPDSTTLVASDLQKLICYTANDVKAPQEASFILNKRHANVLKTILPKEGDVTITFDEKIARIKFADTTMLSCLVVGKYPDYKTIIPKNNSNILQISRVQLLNTVKRIAVCSPKASTHIKFELTQGSLEVSAQDVGFEIAAHDKVECRYDGDDLVIGFKSTHITEILSNLGSEEITLKFADKRRSVLILPSEEDVKVFGIVMPIMVR